MIILNKKRILVLISLVFISIFVFLIHENTGKTDIIQTMALPVSDKIIVLDAGHGKPDEGAESSNRYNRSGN